MKYKRLRLRSDQAKDANFGPTLAVLVAMGVVVSAGRMRKGLRLVMGVVV